MQKLFGISCKLQNDIMSFQANLLNFILKKYVKKIQPSVEERSYTDLREMMDPNIKHSKNFNFVAKLIQRLLFMQKKSDIFVKNIYLKNIRTLYLTSQKFDKKKCILYFHGGGYIAGSPETHLNMLISIANKSAISIYVIDYSLSPEHNYPQAINDALLSYKELINLGYETKNIFMGGDSAGGNLALVSILKLQQLDQLIPSKLFLLSPWTDLTGNGKSIRDNSKSDPYLSYDDWKQTTLSLQKIVKEWYAPNQNHKDPLISPVFAQYRNFPQTLIQVSDIEILLSDSQELHSKISEGNNDVRLSIYKNLPHVWQIFGFLPESKAAINEISDFLKN